MFFHCRASEAPADKPGDHGRKKERLRYSNLSRFRHDGCSVSLDRGCVSPYDRRTACSRTPAGSFSGGVSYSVLVFLRHLRFWSKAHGEVLRYSTLRQQLRHEDEPLVAGIVLIVLPAAGGKGSARCPPRRRLHRQIPASSSLPPAQRNLSAPHLWGRERCNQSQYP